MVHGFRFLICGFGCSGYRELLGPAGVEVRAEKASGFGLALTLSMPVSRGERWRRRWLLANGDTLPQSTASWPAQPEWRFVPKKPVVLGLSVYGIRFMVKGVGCRVQGLC